MVRAKGKAKPQAGIKALWLLASLFLVLLQFLGHQVKPTLDQIDLGLVKYPDLANRYQTAQHDWSTSGVASASLSYSHGLAALEALLSDQIETSNTVSQSKRGLLFRSDQALCRNELWSCLYSQLLARSGQDLAPVLERFKTEIDQKNWKASDVARWLLSFVQAIPYRVPQSEPFGVLPPAAVVSMNWGDCDSKALLLVGLLKYVGIEAVLIVSRFNRHAMVGIALPTSGKRFVENGRDYAWAETTADAPLGWIDPKLLRHDDWKSVVLTRPVSPASNQFLQNNKGIQTAKRHADAIKGLP